MFALSDAQRTLLALVATLVVVFAVQAPVLAHYFFNDDFVPLADIASRSTGGYIKDLFLLEDLTPNWRFLTGLFYLAEYEAFYLNPAPYFAVAVLIHTATAGLIFLLVRRATRNDAAAMFGAGLFGAAAASVPTVGQITALNNVLAAFFVTLAIALLYEALEGAGARWLLYGASVLAFAGAIASNESASVTAPVLALVVLWRTAASGDWWPKPKVWRRIGMLAAPCLALGTAALIGFGTCGCTEAELYTRDNLVENLLLYFGRLLYPIGLEFPGQVERAHLVAGLVLFALAVGALMRGPALPRIAAVFLFLAVVPYLPLSWGAAGRYTYLASVPFSILAAFLLIELGRCAKQVSPALVPAVAFLAIAAVALNAWQTLSQNAEQADASDEWRRLVTAVDDAYPDVPPDSTVYLLGGPITNETLKGGLAQCAVLPAIGEVLWGDAKLFTFPNDPSVDYRARPSYSVFVGEYVDERVVPQPLPVATEAELRDPDVVLLPHVSPEAKGNVCEPDTPTIP
jgi:hypothetical protein